MKDLVFQIEEEFPDARDIEVNGVKMWPFVRIMLRYMMVEKNLGKNTAPAVRQVAPLSLWQRLKIKIFPNLGLWFRRYDAVIFSNNLEKRKLEDKYIDKLSEGIVKSFGPGKTLTINYLSNRDFDVRQLENKDSVDGLLIEWLTKIRRKFVRVQIKEKDEEILKSILSKYELDRLDLESRIRSMLARSMALSLLLKRWRPKLVFTSCYSYYAEVWAARQRGIRTVELQHGIISPLHPGYESAYPLNKDFTAHHLFTFGHNSIKGLDDHIVIGKNSFEVGNYYLEILETRSPDEQIRRSVGQYPRSVCIPTDYYTEGAILEFIVQVAKASPDILYLIVPRAGLSVQGQKLIEGIRNIEVINNYSFQEVVRHCTFHTASNSTCCLEALALGVPNILIDLHNAFEIFNELVDPEFTKFVKTPDEYLHFIRNWDNLSKEKIKTSNAGNFAKNYMGNLQGALKHIEVII